MSFTYITDDDLFKIRHERNDILVSSEALNVIYHRNPPRVLKNTRPPRVRVSFCVSHQLVPHDILGPSYDDGTRVHVARQDFVQPLSVFFDEGPAGVVFDAMLSRVRLPFELRTGVAAELAQAGKRVLLEEVSAAADSPRTVDEFHIGAFIVKRTFLDPELYRSLLWNSDFRWAVMMLVTVVYGGGDDFSECSICLNDYSVGTRVSKVPCSHRFHENCIVTWFKNSQTCPLCRFPVKVFNISLF